MFLESIGEKSLSTIGLDKILVIAWGAFSSTWLVANSQNFVTVICRMSEGGYTNQRMFQVLSIMHRANYRYLNFNHCSSKQQPLKTVGKTEFWNWNNLVILRGKFTFDLMGRSFTVNIFPSVKLNLDSPHKFMVKIPGWKYGFKMVKIHILCIDLRVVCMLTVAPDTCWVGISALQHGLVLNHPLT